MEGILARQDRIGARVPPAVHETLCRAAEEPSTDLLAPPARTLVAALPGDPALATSSEGWRRPVAVTPALVVNLVIAPCHVGATALGERAENHMLTCPQALALNDMPVPAAQGLAEERNHDLDDRKRLRRPPGE
mgnify:CR=1 FL=1